MPLSPKNIPPSTSIFLDANILLEIVLARPQEVQARTILTTNASSSALCISALTAHLVVHFGSAIVPLPILRQFLADYTVLPLEAVDFDWSFMNARGHDFEDALQLAVAVRHACERFITFDRSLYKIYKDLPTLHVELAL